MIKAIHGSFNLSQNYPNPFNPETDIKYSIPQNGLVTIKVYNLLGQEVATLVNEEKNAGEHSIKFNASNLPAGRQGLPSGMYLYKIQSGIYSSTKKMILLR